MKNFVWKGDGLKRVVKAAVRRGIDKTMSEAVIHAKNNHPGWQNRTATAEGSVRVHTFARGTGLIVGVWGSLQVNYVPNLEERHGHFLRGAAKEIYPRLARNLKSAFNAAAGIGI